MGKEYFGQYKVESELGRGGMGVVYKAFDDSLNRHVAIKVLSEQLANDESVVERFKREAKSMAALNDASIIQIYFIGEDNGQPYFAMEFVDGESLSERLKREGRLPISESLAILKQAAQGLALAHGRGVVHRDIKPGNLMLTKDGKVKIADFGIAMVQDLSKRLTNTGEFVGTPGYLSPEVCVGQPVDQRSDIFALGIVLYEMLTGDIPFTESSPLGMMLEVVKAEIPDIRTINADVDERTCQILRRMIAKDPNHRYPDCDELLADLKGTGPISAVPDSADDNAFNDARTTALSQLEKLPDMGTGPVEATRISSPENERPAPKPAVSSPEPSGKGWLPAAIAALLLIGIGGGLLFVFQDRLLGEDQPTVAKTQTLLDSTAANPGDNADNAGTASAADASGEELEAALQVASNDDEVATGSAVQLAQADNTAGGMDGATDATKTAAVPTQREGVATPAASVAAGNETGGTPATSVAAGNESGGAPAAAATAMAANTAAATQKAAVEAAVEVASIREPEPPRDPRMVVMAVGDQALAGPVEQLLENALLDRDFDVLDEAFFPDVGRYADDRGVDLAGLAGLIQSNGGDVLVLAEIDYVGETPLQYYGQYTTLYTANVKIRNISLADRRPMGRGWTSKVDFTTLNADEKAKEAVGNIALDVADALQAMQPN
ncbi:MAG: serine/threonine-protein kinase [Pseudomonadota bacterium]